MNLLANPYRKPPALRLAVLAAFTQTPAELAASLCRFNARDWQDHLPWLDASGLALYLLARLQSLDRQRLLPTPIQRRLQQNLVDNRTRNAELLAETAQINHGLQREDVLFANLKGITLTPESVPDPALRCQLDLDFLVLAEHAGKAQRVLERMGYTLDCISGDTWEFKAGHAQVAHLRDLYKSKPQRCAELHLTDADTVLSRLHIRTYAQTSFPVLSPADLYLAQALHLFKHLCSSFMRAAWLLELHTHTQTRHADEVFWAKLAGLLNDRPQERLALGVVTLLIEQSFGNVAPPPLALMLHNAVPHAVRIWIGLYGQQALLADFPGTKLYLLLERELHPRNAAAARRHAALVPTKTPRMITQGHRGETMRSRLRRYRTQLAYLVFRLRFHCVEGLRYMVESPRFRRILTGTSH